MPSQLLTNTDDYSETAKCLWRSVDEYAEKALLALGIYEDYLRRIKGIRKALETAHDHMDSSEKKLLFEVIDNRLKELESGSLVSEDLVNV